MYVVVRGNYILEGRCWIGEEYYSIYNLPKLGCMTRVVWYEVYDENLLSPEE
jgi:hypothetical protein